MPVDAPLTVTSLDPPISQANVNVDPITIEPEDRVRIPTSGDIASVAGALADTVLTNGTRLINSIRDSVVEIRSDRYAGIFGNTPSHSDLISIDAPQSELSFTPINAVAMSDVNVPDYLSYSPLEFVPPDNNISSTADEISAPNLSGYGFPSDAPSDPGIVVDVAIPPAPTVLLPDVPSLASVSIPDVPVLDIPTFTAQLADSPNSPDPAFSFTEEAYTSSLLSGYRNLVESWVEGTATGVSPEVETAIWNRGRDREAATYGAAMNQVARDFAGRGFPVPPGAAATLAFQALQKAREASTTISRDVMIKQAELEQQNRQFAMQEARQIEVAMMADAMQRAQRQFEVAKYVVEAAVAIYNAQVLKYNADVQAFTARATVYRERIQGELAKLEVYKSQIEGQKLISSLNQQAIEIYAARLEAAKTMIAVYEGQLSGARTTAEVQRIKIDAYKASVEAYGERVRARAGEFQAYASVVEAEVRRQELRRIAIEQYKVQADAANGAASARADMRRADAASRANDVELAKANIEAQWRQAQMQIESQRVAVEQEANQVRLRIGDLELQGKGVQSEAEIRKAEIMAAAEETRIQSTLVIAEMQQQIDASRIESAYQIAVGQINAQIQAASMAMYNISTSESRSQSSSTSLSNAHSTGIHVNTSQSWNHNYSH